MKIPSLLCSLTWMGVALLGASVAAHATTFTVSNLNDAGAGSLRQAVLDANRSSGDDTITFAPALTGTLTLTSGSLTISSNLSIVGPGADALTVSGNHTDRLLTITDGTVALSGLTLANGYIKGNDGAKGLYVSHNGRAGDNAMGGAILNQGILTLTDMSLHDNTAEGGSGGTGGPGFFNDPPFQVGGMGGKGGWARGGGIFNTGTLKLVHSKFKGNTVYGGTGGDGGTLNRGFLTGKGGNGGDAYGGAIFNGGMLQLENLPENSFFFTNNHAIVGQGGQGRPSGIAGSGTDDDIHDVLPTAQNATFSGMAHTAFQAQLVATGDTLTYSLVSGVLPTGLQLNAQTGTITGTPTTAANDQQITYKVNDGFRDSNIATVTFNIQPYNPEPKSLVVTTLSDVVNEGDNLTSLREAVAYAHTLTGSPTITVASGLRGTLTLTRGHLVFTHNLSIIGPQSNGIVVAGNQHDFLFYVQSGTANISNLTLAHGNEGCTLNNGTLNLTGCTMVDNIAHGGGGGLFNRSGTVSITNCTFANNQDLSDVGGGGIYNAGTMTIDSSTVWNNSCVGGQGGGIYNVGTLTLRNSLVADNSAATGPDLYGSVSTGDYNLVKNPAGATLSGSHNITGNDPKLGPLQNNGGPTDTLALLTGSPANDAGQTDLKTDQRGLPRPIGSAADIGAYEDQNTLPVLSVNSPSVREGNGGAGVTPSQLQFTLTLSKVSSQTVSVIVQTTPASTSPATAKSDYVPMGKTRVIFAPGKTSQTVSITIIGDTVYEDNERVALLLSSPSGLTLANSIGEGTIVNDDPAPSVFINDVSVTEGNMGYSRATFTVVLSAPSGRPASVGYSTYSSGRGAALGGTTSTANVDYIAASGTLTFAPGQTSKTITVWVKGDTTVEGDETFFVRLSAPVNARIAQGTGIGTILNDDRATLAQSPPPPSGGNS